MQKLLFRKIVDAIRGTSGREFVIDYVMPNKLIGWYRPSSREVPEFSVYINSTIVRENVTAELYRADLAVDFNDDGKYGFAIDFSPIDSQCAHVEVRHSQSGAVLYSASPEIFRIAGNIDEVTEDSIGGWAFDSTSPGKVMLDVLVDGQVIHTRVEASNERLDLDYLDANIGFSIPVPYGLIKSDSVVDIYDAISGDHVANWRAPVDGVNSLEHRTLLSSSNQQLSPSEQIEKVVKHFDSYYYSQANQVGAALRTKLADF